MDGENDREKLTDELALLVGYRPLVLHTPPCNKII